MREFLDYNFSVPRRARENIGVGGYTKWRGGDGVAGETFVQVATGSSTRGQFPFIKFKTGQMPQHGDIGFALYGEEGDGPGTSAYSSMQIWGGNTDYQSRYRMRQYMSAWKDHPSSLGQILFGLGIMDYADYIADPSIGVTTYEAGITAVRTDASRGWMSYYGSNHHFYDNPYSTAGVLPAVQRNMVIYGPPTNRVDMDNDCWVHGTLSKGSGSFDIEHPVVEGKRLRHSFIEGPQADLIYRGTAELGAAPTVINMDTEFDMTPGTWEALNCTPWSIVSASGKVVEWGFEGSTLTITGDEGTTCMWMVIGERHDPHMKNSSCGMADDHGHVIVEYDEPEPLPEQLPPYDYPPQ